MGTRHRCSHCGEIGHEGYECERRKQWQRKQEEKERLLNDKKSKEMRLVERLSSIYKKKAWGSITYSGCETSLERLELFYFLLSRDSVNDRNFRAKKAIRGKYGGEKFSEWPDSNDNDRRKYFEKLGEES